MIGHHVLNVVMHADWSYTVCGVVKWYPVTVSHVLEIYLSQYMYVTSVIYTSYNWQRKDKNRASKNCLHRHFLRLFLRFGLRFSGCDFASIVSTTASASASVMGQASSPTLQVHIHANPVRNRYSLNNHVRGHANLKIGDCTMELTDPSAFSRIDDGETDSKKGSANGPANSAYIFLSNRRRRSSLWFLRPGAQFGKFWPVQSTWRLNDNYVTFNFVCNDHFRSCCQLDLALITLSNRVPCRRDRVRGPPDHCETHPGGLWRQQLSNPNPASSWWTLRCERCTCPETRQSSLSRLRYLAFNLNWQNIVLVRPNAKVLLNERRRWSRIVWVLRHFKAYTRCVMQRERCCNIDTYWISIRGQLFSAPWTWNLTSISDRALTNH